MASLEELNRVRLQKIEALKKAGMEPYPAAVPRDFDLREARDKFSEYEKTGKTYSVTGRIMAQRGQGAIIFLVLDDGSGTFQAVIKKDVMAAEIFDLLINNIDVGDIISVTGTFMTTQRGEQSILAKEWKMAAKSLSPLPEKWHGLADPDAKFRERYLDFIMEPESRELFYRKATYWDAIRQYMKSQRFLEVETPTLETTTGGAEARPFVTHHNDYDMDVFLRISVGELWQKRLLAAGFPRTYEIGRIYRNEGSSPEHAQEFTNMEMYAAYMTFDEGIKFTEDMIRKVTERTFGTMTFSIKGNKVDMSREWRFIDYVDKIQEVTGINVLEASVADMESKLRELCVEYDGDNRERLTDTLWKYCRRQIVGPAWLVNVPKLVSPLSKANPKDPNTTLRVQLILGGVEVTNGFAELNDPIDQRQRFEEQKKMIEGGDAEAMMPDWDFVEMLEHAMPPAFGFGWGCDRYFAILSGKTLRETHLFPLMRPKK